MPWKKAKEASAPVLFIRRRLGGTETFTASCRASGISRQTGYEWWRLFLRVGLAGLDQRRVRQRCGCQAVIWEARVRRLSRQYRHWGARILHDLLARSYPRARLPAERTLGRWLGPRVRLRRRLAGPRLPALLRTRPSEPNAVWTVDFKGWFRTADDRKIEPLTIRDLHSRFALLVMHQAKKDYPAVRRAMTRVFRRYGLPRAIWCDNGPPFGGEGPLGLTRLSVWWLRLGIRVEYGRPAHPGDNASHENMHGLLQREAASPAAANPAAQAQRLARWVRRYNHVRPQRVLQGRTPAMLYRHSQRRCPRRLPNWPVCPGDPIRRASSGGWICYQGQRRLIGRPFAAESIRLHHRSAQQCAVYLGPHLLGYLHLTETRLRAARHRPSVQRREGARPPPLQPSPNNNPKTSHQSVRC
jgi:putative transposase